MHLTKGFEQAACIVAMLATQEKGIPVSSGVINATLGGSATYLHKIMRKLVVGGLINSVSGNSGGFTLAKEPAEINLLEVYHATEGPVDTFPDNGFFKRAFKDFASLATEADAAITNVFHQADSRWAAYIGSMTVQDILWETFKVQEIPLVDWNEIVQEQQNKN
ncbi:Rrf2 family transcriptional regulator [Ligilactobacillus salitolerans]|uniref:Rrf2 family transcriptional regulator n=1 Tax=Ligilactobacillus salitolerans TaxID=1808352 RepID=A0A401IWF3_9LACO|nr:Rrf2 family transcriptional regulator [Ligilactobacillus salitolerans]GBG95836.1 Rrf2 family transcriptional regulator [Ligilactobacillus salitolerans]